jgi:ketosteroid isomerase-like protein
MAISRLRYVAVALLSALACSTGESTSASDADSIRLANQRYIALHPVGDVDQLMNIYVDDVLLMPPGEAPIEGLDAVRGYWADFFGAWVVTEASSYIDEILVAGDWAWSRGHYSESFRPMHGGDTIRDSGRFSGIWRRSSDGSWKIARDMWQSDGSNNQD